LPNASQRCQVDVPGPIPLTAIGAIALAGAFFVRGGRSTGV
jgi:hypothetical protein